MYWLFMYASQYTFSETTIVKPRQNFLIYSKKPEFNVFLAKWFSWELQEIVFLQLFSSVINISNSKAEKFKLLYKCSIMAF